MRLLRRKGNTSQFIRFFWRDQEAMHGFTTAVSLHSHTLHSREGLDFIPRVLGRVRPAQALLRILEDRHRRRLGKDVPYDRIYWQPPLHPAAAHELEAGQIRDTLRLKPLVSITDHDSIEACAELRALSIDAPFSHEWTVPFEDTVFHIGVHNLPANCARCLFGRMEAVTANPAPEGLRSILDALNAMPDVLVVLNHPLSNEARGSFRTHARLLKRFLREYGGYIHALELNGLQPDSHNRRVASIGAEMRLPVISGGDRHCLEPNANVNLTNAATFTEFVEEVRRERVSRVLFMPQYQEATSCRYVEFISQAVRTYPELAGRQRWVDRVFKETEEGKVALAKFWPNGGPRLIRGFVASIGFLASPHMRGTLRLALGAPQSQLAADVRALPKDRKLCESGELAVYLGSAAELPSVFREIGLLRETAFRQAGEGTGRSMDIDRFDGHYLHLLLWNEARGEVAGAYRLGPTPEILAKHGVGGLYTSTLFRFHKRLFDRIGPAVELGRSFVRSEYQKQYAPLLLLWKGIARFVARRPDCATLFGGVSISSRYHAVSRYLMARFLETRRTHELAAMVAPRCPYRPGSRLLRHSGGMPRVPEDVEELSKLIAELENDGKGVPVLVKQYLKTGGRLLALNVDHSFRDALDALIVVDLRNAPAPLLERFLGKPGATAFAAWHAAAQGAA